MQKIQQTSTTPLEEYTADGRKPFAELRQSFDDLTRDGWIKEEVANSTRMRGGQEHSLPILSYRTEKKGPAVWIIGGIHGEEPAGPNAIAEGIPYIKELGKDTSMVLLPVCNPLGYQHSWRYLNIPKWADGVEVHSVGDSEHVLPDLKRPDIARSNGPLSPEAGALVEHILKLVKDYPPIMSIDLHEDDLIHEGYIYSQGGHKDLVANKVVELLSSKGIAIKKMGKTRFSEEVKNGIVGWENDGSVDELLSSKKIIVDGQIVPGPGARTAIVVETPAGALPLEQRKAAHLEALKHVKELAQLAQLQSSVDLPKKALKIA